MTTSQAPVVIELTLYDTELNRKKWNLLNKLEIMFDDKHNQLTTEWYNLEDIITWGGKVKITIEVL